MTALHETPRDYALGVTFVAFVLALPVSAVLTAFLSRKRRVVPKGVFAGIALATLVFFGTHALLVLLASSLAYVVQALRTA